MNSSSLLNIPCHLSQIEQIDPGKRNLIVALCGDHHDENLVARLHERYKMYDVPFPSSPRIVVKKDVLKTNKR